MLWNMLSASSCLLMEAYACRQCVRPSRSPLSRATWKECSNLAWREEVTAAIRCGVGGRWGGKEVGREERDAQCLTQKVLLYYRNSTEGACCVLVPSGANSCQGLLKYLIA